MQAEEFAVSKARQNPAFHDLNAGFHFGLVFGFAHPGGDHHGAIMIGQIQISGIDIGLIKAGLFDTGFQIIGNQYLGHAAQKGKSACAGADPVGKCLCPGGFSIAIIRSAEHRHKYLSIAHFGTLKIVYANGHAGIVNKHLFASHVVLSHDCVDGLCPAAVQFTKLTVLVALRMLLLIFLPQ